MSSLADALLRRPDYQESQKAFPDCLEVVYTRSHPATVSLYAELKIRLRHLERTTIPGSEVPDVQPGFGEIIDGKRSGNPDLWRPCDACEQVPLPA